MRLPQFTIRDLLWLMVVVALVCGWWVQLRSIPQPDKSLTGTITVAGEPLKAGRIYYYGAEGQFRGAFVVDGQYQIENIPVGDYQVTIEGENVPPLYSNMPTKINDRTKAIRYGLHSAEHLARIAGDKQ